MWGVELMPSGAEAVEALEQLGLSEYEARCFVALTQLSTGTAKEIAQIADVPQSRVYDITEDLHGMGLVDIEQADPKRYFALPVDAALQTLREEFDTHLDTADRHLSELDGRDAEDNGVWEIATREAVRSQALLHIRNATDEVYLLIAHETLLEDELVDALDDAASDVTVWVEVPTAEAKQRVGDALPRSTVAVTDCLSSTLPEESQTPGRLLMVDRETILLSAQKDGLIPNENEESGIWGRAVGHGLVGWVRHLLETRRDRLSFETASG